MAFSLYRVVRASHPPFDGSGAARFGARWTSPGRAAIYTARSYAGALLEVLAHARRADLRVPYHSLVIGVPDGLSVTTIHAEDVPGWDAMDYVASRVVGDAWHVAGTTALLDVPSVLGRPHERNVVINPHHADVHRLHLDPPLVGEAVRATRHASGWVIFHSPTTSETPAIDPVKAIRAEREWRHRIIRGET